MTLKIYQKLHNIFSLFLLLVGIILLNSAVEAATYTVTTTADSGAGSLRQAISDANATVADDTITFAIAAGDPNCTAGGVCTITLTSGELTVNAVSTAGKLTITNPTGARNLLISGNNVSRVFFLKSNSNLTLNGLTVKNGNGRGTTNTSYNGYGGGIITDSNSALTLTNSTVSGNTVQFDGAGILNNGGSVTITNSTLNGNVAQQFAGGIGNQGPMTLTNSTLSGNTAQQFAGGILNQSTITLNSVTITQNRTTSTSCSDCAGGIYNAGTANLNNTIVAGNTAANSSASPDFRGAISASSSYNIIGNNQGTTGINNGSGGTGNQIGTSASPINPQLEALADNGGPTETHKLKSNSPAIDKGSSFSLTIDQRGQPRPVDLNDTIYPDAADAADIGAYELQTATAASVSVGGRVLNSTGAGIRGALVTLTDAYGNSRTVFTGARGAYRFSEVQAGETYILSVAAKRFKFTQPSVVLNVSEELTEVNFIAVDLPVWKQKDGFKDF